MEPTSSSKEHSLTPTRAEKPEAHLERSSLLVMTMTLLSRMIGLLRIRILASYLGASLQGDLLYFTLQIPNNFRKILAEGAFTSAYVPELARIRTEHPEEEASFMLTTFTILSALTLIPVLLLIFAGTLILSAWSGFDAQLIKNTGAVLSAVFSLYLAGIMLTAFFADSQHVRGRFFIASLAPLILSISVILWTILGYSAMGAAAPAWGFALGSIIGAAAIAFSMVKGKRVIPGAWRVSLRIASPCLRHWGVLSVMSMMLFASQQVSYYLASSLDPGSVIIFSNAVIIWQLPFGICVASIITVMYPHLARSLSSGDSSSLREETFRTAQYILAGMVPAMIFLFIFSTEISASILLSGNYTLEAVMRTSVLLRYFIPGVLSLAVVQLGLRVLYIARKWKHAALLTLVVTLTDIILSVTLVRTSLELNGLAAAFTLVNAAAAVYIYSALMQGRGGMHLKPLVLSSLLFLAWCAILKAGTAHLGLFTDIPYMISLAVTAAGSIASAAVLVLLYRKFSIPLFSLRRTAHPPS